MLAKMIEQVHEGARIQTQGEKLQKLYSER